jgi:hypothetical protein
MEFYMESFKQYFVESKSDDVFLMEKLITLGGQAYPKFGQVVILAGGAGSGKGFQISNLLGIEGKVFDVDALKKMAIKSKVFAAKVKKETGYDLKNFDLRKPENVSKLHDILGATYSLDNKDKKRVFAGILAAAPDRKPNLIFDVTLRSLSKLDSIARNVAELGYDKSSIHIVWVVNDIEVAIEQNKKRDRVVPEEILIGTHEGVALTMKKVLDMGGKLSKYMDGDIWLTFNKAKVDTKLETSASGTADYKGKTYKTAGDKGTFISQADYFRIKQKDKPQLSSDKIGTAVYQKIKAYIPQIDSW